MSIEFASFEPSDIMHDRAIRVNALVSEILVHIRKEMAEELTQFPETSEYSFTFQNFPDDAVGLVLGQLNKRGWKFKYNNDAREVIIELPMVCSQCPEFTGTNAQPSTVKPL